MSAAAEAVAEAARGKLKIEEFKKINMKEKRAKRKPITKILLVLVLILVLLGGFIVYDKFIKPSKNKNKVVDSIKNEDVDYIVNDNDTKLFKESKKEKRMVVFL